jgi:D-alanyl-D-alanine carboxypeptidase
LTEAAWHTLIRVDDVRAVLDEVAGRLLASGQTPGLVVAATDGNGPLLEAYYGWADVAARVPTGRSTLFQIGSITKVATAILAVQLWEDGDLDLARPVRGYLGWLPEEPYGRITARQLLSHTSGLGPGSDLSPPSRFMALSATQARTAQPGPFRYSNAGFQVLGILVEDITGKPYPKLISERILQPLEMTASAAVITSGIRPALAIGYAPSPDDLPFQAGDGLAPAPFFEYTAGDGSMACTATELAAFARMLINRGKGVLGAKGFELLTTPVADIGDKESICHGVFAGDKYGHPDLNHGGSMVGYESMLCVDRDSGLGVVTMSNGVGDPIPVARATLDALRQVRHGERPTAPPPPPAPRLADYAGRYGGHRVELSEERLRLDGAELHHIRDDAFAMKGSPFVVRFGRRDGEVIELSHGPDHWSPRAGNKPYPPEWDGYCGQYRAHQPFEPTFRIFVRDGVLHQAWPTGRENALIPDGGAFNVNGTRNVLAFDTPAGPHFLRAVLSGCPFYRTLTPRAPRPGGA